MDHHIVADVDTHMADAGGIIGSGEKHQIARFGISQPCNRLNVFSFLRSDISIIGRI